MKCSQLVLVVVALWCSAILDSARACSCDREHAQQQYCATTIPIRATVLDISERDFNPGGSDDIRPEFTIRLHKAYMNAHLFDAEQGPYKIYSYAPEEDCGAMLKNNTQYMLGLEYKSGYFWVRLCGLIREWDSLTSDESKYFRSKYHPQCTRCLVVTEPNSETGVDPARHVCVWNPDDVCFEKHAFCQENIWQCRWKRSSEFDACINEQNNAFDRRIL